MCEIHTSFRFLNDVNFIIDNNRHMTQPTQLILNNYMTKLLLLFFFFNSQKRMDFEGNPGLLVFLWHCHLIPVYALRSTELFTVTCHLFHVKTCCLIKANISFLAITTRLQISFGHNMQGDGHCSLSVSSCQLCQKSSSWLHNSIKFIHTQYDKGPGSMVHQLKHLLCNQL